MVERALNEYDLLVVYLWGEWGENITVKVSKKIDQSVLRLKQSPEQFPIINQDKRIQRCVVSNQTSIFFTISNDSIIILSLFDNRQDPQKKNL